MRDFIDVTSAELLATLVSDVLAANPAAAQVFVEYRMGCVGCTFAPFETVAEVARVYGIESCALVNSLAEATSKEVRQ